MPMDECSPRADATRREGPSGGHSNDPIVPLAVNKRLAAADPSRGADHTCTPLIKASHFPVGEITGSSPSDKYFGSPPSNGMLATWTLKGSSSNPGSVGRSVSQLPLCSPPRTNTSHLPSSEKERLVISWPSSFG